MKIRLKRFQCCRNVALKTVSKIGVIERFMLVIIEGKKWKLFLLNYFTDIQIVMFFVNYVFISRASLQRIVQNKISFHNITGIEPREGWLFSFLVEYDYIKGMNVPKECSQKL